MPVIPAQTVELKESDAMLDGKAQRTDTKRTWHVFTDTDGESVFVAVAAPGIPLLGDVHPQMPGLRVTRIQPKRIHRRQFLIQAEYSSDYQAPGDGEENPLDRRGEVTYDTTDREIPTEETTDSPPVGILTRTLERFSPPITTQTHRLTVSVTQNASTSGHLRIAPYLHTLNQESFLGLPPLCVKFSKFRSSAKRHATFGLYWERNYVFEYIPPDEYADYSVEDDLSPWDARPLHKGYYSVNPAGTEIIANLDRTGANVERLLDGDGFELALGSAPVYLHFRIHRREIWLPGLEIDPDRLDY